MEKMIKDKFDIESGFIRFRYIANFKEEIPFYYYPKPWNGVN